MRIRKATGRYGPQKSCAHCGNHCGDKVFRATKDLAWCGQECFTAWVENLIAEKKECDNIIEANYKNTERLKQVIATLHNELREYERTIQGHYGLIDKVQKQLSLAGVPNGGNILDRLEYLVEDYLVTRKYIPRISYIMQSLDDDKG